MLWSRWIAANLLHCLPVFFAWLVKARNSNSFQAILYLQQNVLGLYHSLLFTVRDGNSVNVRRDVE